MRDTTRQIPHSKLPRPIYYVLTQSSNVLWTYSTCCVRFRHGSLFFHRASGCVNSSSAARALCGIGIVAYVSTFLVSIFHLPLSHSYLASFGDSLTNTHLTSRAFAITWTWRHVYKRGWVTFGFPTRSIAHREINTRETNYFLKSY